MAMDESNREGDQLDTCLVLGGRGRVGTSLVLRLLKLGKWIVRVADSAKVFHLDSSLAHAFSSGRASYIQVDVRDKSQIVKAMEGISVVFYLDTTELYTNDFYTCYTVIVEGAKNVINACRDLKVKRLIYNSSADVVFDSRHEIHKGDESLPYAGKVENMLADLKAQAEALVLLANDTDGLLTCALRPVNVFGPGDTDLVLPLVNMAKSGWSKFIIGSGNIISDFTFVENVAHAHICAEAALRSRILSASGKAFFITNFEPINFSEFISAILEGVGYNRPVMRVPSWIARYVVLLIKSMHLNMDHGSVYKILELGSCTRTFSCFAAQRQIGYSPVVSLQEGIALTTESLSQYSRGSSFVTFADFDEESKVEKLLGSGKVADILLWRDEKKTFTCFVSTMVLYYWFFLCGRTFISSAAKLLLLIVVFLGAYGVLPSRILSFTIPRLQLSSLEISEMDTRDVVSTIVYTLDKVTTLTKSLAEGEDWHTFFKVAAFLYSLKFVVSHSLTMAIGVGVVLAFTVFLVYEQFEGEINGAVAIGLSMARTVLRSLIKMAPATLSSYFPDIEISEANRCSTLHSQR